MVVTRPAAGQGKTRSPSLTLNNDVRVLKCPITPPVSAVSQSGADDM